MHSSPDRIQLDNLRAHLSGLSGPLVDSARLGLELAIGLLETAHVIVVVLDPEGRVQFCNGFYERLTGFSLAELHGKSWFDTCLPSQTRASVVQRFHGVMAGAFSVGHVNAIVTSVGAERIVEWHDRTLCDANGGVIGILAIGHDITARVDAIEALAASNTDLEARFEQRSRELRTANAELETSRQVLEGTFQSTRMCIAYLDCDFDFVRVNDAYAAADARSAADFVGRNHFELYPNEDNRRTFERVRDSGEPYNASAKPFEYAHARERGVTHWDWTLMPVKDDAGRVQGLVLALLDVTDRVRALEASQTAEARASEERHQLREVLDSMFAFVAVYSVDGRLLEANRAPLELAGLTRDDVIGKPFWETLWWSHSDATKEQVRRALQRAAAGETVRDDFQVRLAGDRFVTLDATFGPLRDAEGRITRLIGSGVDVSERERVRRDLTVKDAAIESSINAIALASLDGVVDYVNPAFLSLWGLLDRSEALGRSVLDFWTSRGEAAIVLKELFARGAWFGRMRGMRADGSCMTLQVSAHVVRDRDGTPIRAMASFVDVTAQEDAAVQLAGQLTEKEILLKEIHHRVKNNLQVISSMLYLQSAQTDDPSVAALFRDSRDRVRAMALVHETLYESAELGRVDFKAYAQRLVAGIATSYEGTASRVSAEIAVDAPSLAIHVAIPCGLITNELVANAYKYAFEGRERGHVRVMLDVQGGQCRLRVEDDGIGLPSDCLSSSKTLGIRLVRALAGQLGGQLDVEPGAGSKLVVTFPAQD